jgi:tRNA pseudouridine55 synthase
VNGWLILDKPIGPSSTQALGAVKRLLREGGYPKQKIGHGGTLDPLASGVLPIALGEATKLSGRMLDADKAYDFTIAFGAETDTLDGEGKIIATSDKRPTLAEIEAVLPLFTGPIDQIPPAYSALKIDGERAYTLARAGAEVKLAMRAVTIHSLKILPGTGRGTMRSMVEGALRSGGPLHHARSGRGPPPRSGEELEHITLSARVSKGTYIRSLARDIARALDSVGSVTMLQRTKAGPFTLESAISLDNLAEAAKGRTLEQHLLPLTAGLDDIPALTVSPDQARALRQGRTLAGIAAKPGLLLATDADGPVALVELREGELRVVRGFNL